MVSRVSHFPNQSQPQQQHWVEAESSKQSIPKVGGTQSAGMLVLCFHLNINPERPFNRRPIVIEGVG